MTNALKGLKLIDLTRVRAGPSAVRHFADWGADIIKIELPNKLGKDIALGGSRYGSDFQNLHRNKRSITLNLKSKEGIKILLKRFAARQTAKVASKWIPFVGQIIAASLGFFITQQAGYSYRDDCHEVAKAILEDELKGK